MEFLYLNSVNYANMFINIWNILFTIIYPLICYYIITFSSLRRHKEHIAKWFIWKTICKQLFVVLFIVVLAYIELNHFVNKEVIVQILNCNLLLSSTYINVTIILTPCSISIQKALVFLFNYVWTKMLEWALLIGNEIPNKNKSK